MSRCFPENLKAVVRNDPAHRAPPLPMAAQGDDTFTGHPQILTHITYTWFTLPEDGLVIVPGAQVLLFLQHLHSFLPSGYCLRQGIQSDMDQCPI